MSKFIKIPNKMFVYDPEQEGTEIYKVGVKGFTVWAYMLALQGGNDFLPITIEALAKQMDIRGLKDGRTLKPILLNLKRLNYIVCEDLSEKTKPKDLIYIKVWKYESDNFSIISTKLIYDNVSKLGCVGFVLYCLMYKEHNTNLGNQSATDFGYCQRKTKWFAERLNVDRKTVESYIKKIPKGLVKVEEQEPMVTQDYKGEEKYTQQAKRYYVKAKYDIGNKYYIEQQQNKQQ